MKSIKTLQDKLTQSKLGGGIERINKQHKDGKLTARERIDYLLDKDSFIEFDALVTHRCTNFGMDEKKFYGDGVITGGGKILGRKVFVFSQDFTVFGGSLSASYAKKICKVMDLAYENRCPLIGINDSGGARIQEGVESLAGYADIFYRNVRYSGVIPQFSLVMGPCAGGAVYSPAITDFIFMVDKTSHMFITGPDVIRAVTKEEVTKEDLGGANTHFTKSGVAHFVNKDDKSCIDKFKEIFSYIPQSFDSIQIRTKSGDTTDRETLKIQEIIPENNSASYDIRKVITEIADNNIYNEIQSDYAQNISIGFIRQDGRSVGVIANNPKYLAGCLDISASCKAARFVRFCDSFNIPILTFVDVPGFLPGVRQEHGGIINHGAKLLYAYAESTVPKITIITRKAFGGAYDVMSSKHIGSDLNFAFPSAEVAVMGPEAAVNIIFRRELDDAERIDELENERKRLIDEYKEKFANPWEVASLGFIDAVIDPKDTRKLVIQGLEMLENKKVEAVRKKHGGIPL